MARRISAETKQEIIALWKAGQSQNYLADKFGVSVGTVNKLCKNTPQENADLVNAQVIINKEVSTKNEYEMNAIHSVVNEKTKHVQFFDNAAVLNIQEMLSKINQDTKIAEHKMAGEAIEKAKTTVCGRLPDTAIQINNQAKDEPIINLTLSDGN